MDVEGEAEAPPSLSEVPLSLQMVCGEGRPSGARAASEEEAPPSMAELIVMAERSKRRCDTEGEYATAKGTIFVCEKSGYSVSEGSKRHPNYAFVAEEGVDRLPPSLVQQTLTRALPMVLSFRHDATAFTR